MDQPVRTYRPGEAAAAWPTPSRAWATVFVLMAAYALAFVDRQILTLLVEPVRRDLNINDTQFSLLSGLAFTLFYTVMGLPFAWLADRSSRRMVPPADQLLDPRCGAHRRLAGARGPA